MFTDYYEIYRFRYFDLFGVNPVHLYDLLEIVEFPHFSENIDPRFYMYKISLFRVERESVGLTFYTTLGPHKRFT